MAKNVVITKTSKDRTQHVLRKFTQRVRSSGLIMLTRSRRYKARPLSAFKAKKSKLRRISRKNEFEQLIKEGKISESVRGKRVRWQSQSK